MADDGSFDEFARTQYASLTRYAVALTGNRHTADDLVQETLARVLGAWRRVRQDGNPVGYATTAMFRTYISIWRKTRISPITVELAIEPQSHTDRYATVDNRLELVRGLRALPRLQQAVLVATYLTDHTDAEIAEFIGRSPSTVRSLRHRGLKALRVELGLNVSEEVPDGDSRIATA